jgi:hypothetical protein
MRFQVSKTTTNRASLKQPERVHGVNQGVVWGRSAQLFLPGIELLHSGWGILAHLPVMR